MIGTMTSNNKKPLMTAREVAEFLGVPVATLYHWRYHGRGPRALRVGRHLRFRIEDVEQWLNRPPATRG